MIDLSKHIDNTSPEKLIEMYSEHLGHLQSVTKQEKVILGLLGAIVIPKLEALAANGGKVIKAKISFWKGKWWCRRIGITGCGETPKEAWDDMWFLYKQAVSPKQCLHPPKVRA